LGLPENGDYIPSPGMSVRPIQRTNTGETLDSVFGNKKAINYKETPQITNIINENLKTAKDAGEAATILDEVMSSYEGADQKTLKSLHAAVVQQLKNRFGGTGFWQKDFKGYFGLVNDAEVGPCQKIVRLSIYISR
jgi:hypothetical protein